MNILSKDHVAGLYYIRSEELEILHEAMLCAREHLCVRKGLNSGFYEKYRKFTSFVEAFKPIQKAKKDVGCTDMDKAKYAYQKCMFELELLKKDGDKE